MDGDIFNVAIKDTIALHQLVLDGKCSNYGVARIDWNDGDCPLCAAFSGCDVCPWVTIQGAVKRNVSPCHDSEFDFYNDAESIERLNSWLRGEKYETN